MNDISKKLAVKLNQIIALKWWIKLLHKEECPGMYEWIYSLIAQCYQSFPSLLSSLPYFLLPPSEEL